MIETQPKESEVNGNKTYNEHYISITTDSTKKEYNMQIRENSDKQPNGHCRISDGEEYPNDSENKLRDNLSEIHTKGMTTKNSEPNRSPVNEPGPSQNTKEEASCGIYYGIKSYLHQFYGPPDKEVLKSGEYVQGDDFRFLAEPRRKSCWIRVGLWIGINLILLGGIAMLVGYLTPPRQAIVGQFAEYTVLDRWAVNFNYHLMMCQLVGLITFSFGAIIIICSLLMASCQPPSPPPAYLVMGACLTPSNPDKQPANTPAWGIHCIPLSGTVTSVQPNLLCSHY